jgi:DNA-binding transcriptional regulator YhcF (GntR family)
MTMSDKKVDLRIVEQITEEITAAVLARTADGRVTCPVLRKLAEELGVPYKVVGAAADLAGIRLSGCDLGCF